MGKRPDGFWEPVGEADYETSAQFGVGDIELFEVKKVRNPGLHRKYFALIRILYDNQGEIKGMYQFRKLTEMRAGWYDPITTKKGIYYLPKSISYERMENAEFERLYNAVLDNAFAAASDKERLIEQINTFA